MRSMSNLRPHQANHQCPVRIWKRHIARYHLALIIGLLALLLSSNANALSPIEFVSATFADYEDFSNRTILVNVQKPSPDAIDASVEFTVTNGTAIEGTDFHVLTSSPLAWSGTDTTPKSIEIVIIDDGLVERDEAFQITLSNPQDNNGEVPQAILGTLITT
ncbi:MAG: Calx-beta domain-containing protein, partial [Candidatus Thiodiazotropha sp.]